MTWTLLNAQSGFEEHASDWDSLNRKSGNHVLLSSDFVQSLIRYFLPPSGLTLARYDDPEHPIMLLAERTGRLGWSTFQPAQQPLGAIVGPPRPLESAGAALVGMMGQLPGFSLGFGVTKQDPDFSCFGEVGPEQSVASVEIIESITTAKVNVESTFEDYWSERPKKFTSNIARRQRKLDREGIAWEFGESDEPADMARQVAEYGRIESSGWKAQEGTAVHASNRQGRFYSDVLAQFASAGEAVVYFLKYGDQVVASQLCLRRGDMLVFLKMTYDEQFKEYSPGFHLRAEILKRVFSAGVVRRVEFYGQVREGWTLNWTDDVRKMFHVNIFRYPWLQSARRAVKTGRSSLTMRRSG